jgi:hypothetical protein
VCDVIGFTEYIVVIVTLTEAGVMLEVGESPLSPGSPGQSECQLRSRERDRAPGLQEELNHPGARSAADSARL